MSELPQQWSVRVLVAAAALGAVSIGLGTYGYSQYLPEAGMLDDLYRAIDLLTIDMVDRPAGQAVPASLQVARLLAVLATTLTIFAAFALLLQGWWRRQQAVRTRGHVVVIGGSTVAKNIAKGYGKQSNGKTRRVVWITNGAGPLGEDMSNVLAVGDGHETLVTGFLRGATSVFVAEDADDATIERAARTSTLLESTGDEGRTIVRMVLRDPEKAEALRPNLLSFRTERVRLEVCAFDERIAGSVLRDVEPIVEGHSGPPPVILGRGTLAEELLRRAVQGWHRPGIPMRIDVVTDDCRWADDVAEHLADAAAVSCRTPGGDPRVMANAALEFINLWEASPKQKERTQPLGPRIYIAGLASIETALVAQYLARDSPKATIRAVVPTPLFRFGVPAEATGSVIATVDELLSRPDVLEADATELLARELYLDHRRWSPELPHALGEPPPAGSWGKMELPRRNPYIAVADAVPQAVHHAGCAIGSAGKMAVLLPGELVRIAEALTPALDAGAWADQPRAKRYAVLELAAQLPRLLGRLGLALHRPAVARALFDEASIQRMAPYAHEVYRGTAKAWKTPGEHQFADTAWEDLDPYIHESNRAQVAHIPVKLASCGLDIVPLPNATVEVIDPAILAFLSPREHTRWWHLQRLAGYRPDAKTDHQQRTHTAMRPWDELEDDMKQHDINAVAAMPALLHEVDLGIAPMRSRPAWAVCRRAG